MDSTEIEARHIIPTSVHKSESSIRSYSNRLTEYNKLEISSTLGEDLVSKDSKLSSTDQLPVLSDQEVLELFNDDTFFTEVTTGNKENCASSQDLVLCCLPQPDLPNQLMF